MSKRGHLVGLAAVALIGSGIYAAGVSRVDAHAGATGIVKERMDDMKVLGDHMKMLAAMFTGKTDYDTGKVRGAAKDMRTHADKMPSQFPKGSNPHPSEAKDSIWSDWQGFEKAAAEFGQAATKLGEVASDKGAAEGAFKAVGASCSACHKPYRAADK